ncbi:MAG: YHS domain-containing protein [Deltaproteobacteria bacterium]|nr:YHS domain-containing protein [Deltaproteobacteria bacterium]
MLRFLWLLLIVFLIYQLVRSLAGHFFPAPRSDKGSAGQSGEELVKDPQCGVYFPKSQGVTVEIDGRRLHFCSPACRDAFLQKK